MSVAFLRQCDIALPASLIQRLNGSESTPIFLWDFIIVGAWDPCHLGLFSSDLQTLARNLTFHRTCLSYKYSHMGVSQIDLPLISCRLNSACGALSCEKNCLGMVSEKLLSEEPSRLVRMISGTYFISYSIRRCLLLPHYFYANLWFSFANCSPFYS
jgi:hypothetical protein